jgi:hypothetical protein
MIRLEAGLSRWAERSWSAGPGGEVAGLRLIHSLAQEL